MHSTTTKVEGWCNRRDSEHNGQWMHSRNSDCIEFISDAALVEELLRDARARDRRTVHHYPSGATSPAEAFISDHRPY